MKLTPLCSNLTEVEIGSKIILFSYKTPVAYRDLKTNEMYRTTKRWSATTSRHLNAWFGGYIGKEIDQSELDNLVK